MQFRHEVKHKISNLDMLILRQRLGAVMAPDCHAPNGEYEVRSLYFDNLEDKALREKLDGVYVREKYRIRLYNNDSALLTPEQARRIAGGDVRWMAESANNVILGFYSRICSEGLAAKAIVDYTRKAFVFGPGNVRVTLDSHIRTALRSTDFLNPHCATVPVPDSPCILEVKWDNYLPDAIRDMVQLGDRCSSAYSKYAACRMYD